MRVFRAWSIPVAVLAVALSAGCGGQGRQPVSGTVTVGGAALESGSITFFNPNGPPGPQGGDTVVYGRFSIPAEQGLMPGTYRVEISRPVPGGERTPEQVAAGASAPYKESIPAKYNSESKLTAEVKAGGKNELTFTLD